MKLPLSWLRDHLEFDCQVDMLATALTGLGLEVEAIEDPASRLSAFTVAGILDLWKHPNAERLSVCRLATKQGEVQVVCGAPNVRIGMRGVFAPPGTVVPGTGLHLRRTSIRGVESAGMLCSERELLISDEHDGIIELPQETEIGVAAAPHLGLIEPVLTIAITPNRGDCLGVRGIARDLAARRIGQMVPLKLDPIEGSFDSPLELVNECSDPRACPLFVGRYIRGVSHVQSPEWIRRRLAAIGQRSISALVDITNYLTHDLARPLHVFDADRVGGGRIVIRTGHPPENLLALNGKEYTIDEEMVVIGDGTGAPLGLGGVIGGVASGCDEGSVNIFLETALFDPRRTAATGRRLGLQTEARHRFERGIDSGFVEDGALIATAMILRLCGGEPSRIIKAGEAPMTRPTIHLRPDRVAGLGGIEISQADQERILTDLGCACVKSEGSDWLEVTGPTWRNDLEGEADLVEEILRVRGYDAIPEVSLVRSQAVSRPACGESWRRAVRLRRFLAARGLQEVVSFSFLSSERAALFGARAGDPSLRLLNPIHITLDHMRPSLLPNLIEIAARACANGVTRADLFEIGAIYSGNAPSDQRMMATGLHVGDPSPHWHSEQSGLDVFSAKSDLVDALAELGVPYERLRFTGKAQPGLHPGQSGVALLGSTPLGWFGALHPEILAAYDLPGPAVAFAIELESLPARRRAAMRRPFEPPQLHPIQRDLAFIVDDTVRAADVMDAVLSIGRKQEVQAELFDLYSGEHIPQGKKSLAIRVIMQPRERSMTDREIDELIEQMVTKAAQKTGASLRS